MSKAFIADVVKQSTGVSGVVASQATNALVAATVREIKKTGKFTLSSFGTFTIRKTRVRKALNPRTGEAIRVRSDKTVRLKPSPLLRKAV